MHGGVILFRGAGADARRYVEADRSRADDYYLGADTSVAEFTVLDRDGNVTAALGLEPEAYAGWVDWINPLTGWRVHQCDSTERNVRVHGDLAILTHTVTTLSTSSEGGQPARLVERETIVFAQREVELIVIHEHLSSVPADDIRSST